MSERRERPRPRDDLRALEGYHSPQLEVDVRLNTNESPFAPPAAFVDQVVDRLQKIDWNRYPDRGATELRERLGAFLGQPSERLLCGNGSNEVLQTLLLTYGGAGRSALMFEPTYALHAQLARGTATTIVTGERNADFTLDPAGAARVIERERPAIVFLCSPNNPTGTVDSRAVVEGVLTAARSVGALVIVDEAYGEFAPWSALELIDDGNPLVVVRTYSKVWSLAAVRLGFAVAPAWVIAEIEKVLLPYNLSVPTQIAGVAALDFRTDMEQRVASLVEERGRCSPRSRQPRESRCFPRARTSYCFVLPATRTTCGSACSPAACSYVTSRRGRASRIVCVSRSARAPRTMLSSLRSARPCRRYVHEPRVATAARDEGDEGGGLARRRRRRRDRRDDRHPLLRPHARTTREARGLRSEGGGDRRSRG
jgi:histidinol-phosphate aminotransferase